MSFFIGALESEQGTVTSFPEILLGTTATDRTETVKCTCVSLKQTHETQAAGLRTSTADVWKLEDFMFHELHCLSLDLVY